MERALSHMIGKLDEATSVYIFVDDILVSSVVMDNHLRDLQKVFDLLRQTNLKLNSSQCSLGQRHIRLLGYIVTPEGITSNSEKVDAIRRIAIPKGK